MEIDDFIKQNPIAPEKKFKRKTFLFMLLTSIAAQTFAWLFGACVYLSLGNGNSLLTALIFAFVTVMFALGSIAYVIGAGVYVGNNA